MNREEWSRAHRVFQAVADLDDGERLDTLERLGVTDPEVAATVRALLDGHAMTAGPFDRLEAALAGRTPGFGDAPAEGDEATVVGGDPGQRWHRIGELGRGGMGVVHLAEDRSLGRRVAIKTLAADVASSPGARRRLLQEARTVASLDHPNIVPIHEVGVDDEGSLFLVFGFTPGETLKARLERDGALPVPLALDVAVGVARALAAAHDRGVVHRDVKPSNILVGDDGTVRLTDFGIARRPAAAGMGPAFGTPAYVPPEAETGSPPDPRADVWALGVVLHEMVWGRRPDGVDHGFPPLDDPRGEAVVRVLGRMLASDPADRFADGSGMLVALEESRVGTAGGFVSDAPPRPSRVRGWGVLAGGLALVSAVAWWSTREAPPLPPADAGSRGHVLWVDDDPALSAGEEGALARGGYRVSRALSTAEALAVYDPSTHDLVVSDLGRTESGAYNATAGLEMVRALRARDPGVRVVFFTSDRALPVIETAPEAAWIFGATTTSDGLFDLIQRAAGGGL